AMGENMDHGCIQKKVQEKFLQERIKVGGKAGALGDSVTVSREKNERIKIDEELLQEVVNMGFDRNHLVESLCNRIQNE
ncbi:hypothetical protein S245_070853, partial [Arachis hypogaea]